QVEAVARLRRNLPEGGVLPTDYTFRNTEGQATSLSSLFGEHDTLMIYSLMYGPNAARACPMCAAFLDGWRGQIGHLQDRVSFAVVAQNTPEKIKALQAEMGWQDLPMFSAENSSYQTDYLAQSQDGAQLPMLNVFQRENGVIRHFWGSEMFYEPSDWHPRHIDMQWSLWNMLDLTPQGREDHFPTLR
ncbi:MAG: DUF899 family protein, partial [Paracoccaceae bacterium]